MNKSLFLIIFPVIVLITCQNSSSDLLSSHASCSSSVLHPHVSQHWSPSYNYRNHEQLTCRQKTSRACNLSQWRLVLLVHGPFDEQGTFSLLKNFTWLFSSAFGSLWEKLSMMGMKGDCAILYCKHYLSGKQCVCWMYFTPCTILHWECNCLSFYGRIMLTSSIQSFIDGILCLPNIIDQEISSCSETRQMSLGREMRDDVTSCELLLQACLLIILLLLVHF